MIMNKSLNSNMQSVAMGNRFGPIRAPLKAFGSMASQLVLEFLGHLNQTKNALKATGNRIDQPIFVSSGWAVFMTSIKILQWVGWTLRPQLTRINKMAKELRFGAMVVTILVTLWKEWKKAMVFISGLMAANILACGRMMRWVDSDISNGLMDDTLKGCSRTVSCMAMVTTCGKMAEDMKAIIVWTRSTEKAHIHTQMEASIEVNGKMEHNTAKVASLTQIHPSNVEVFGHTVSYRDG